MATQIVSSRETLRTKVAGIGNSLELLTQRIKDKAEELKAEGTVGMSKANLKQLVSTKGLQFANPYHFEQSFDEALAKANLGSFVIRASKKSTPEKYARLRQVATEEPKEVDAALGEVAEALGTMSDALIAFKENLDLIEAPKTASLKIRVATAKKYAASFKRLAADTPEVLADALGEIYLSLDDVAAAIENLAENIGVELNATPAEEGDPDSGEPFAGDNFDKSEETKDETETEEKEPESEPKDESEEKEEPIDKEAAGTDWTTDRDEDGKPKTVNKLTIPAIASARESLRNRIAARLLK